MADQNGTSSTDYSTQTAFAVIAGVAAILVACVVFIFYFTRDKAMVKEIIEMQRRFDLFKEEMQAEQQKKLFKYHKTAKDFLKQYKKPLLQSAFDLQSRLTNQVKNNFLYSFLQERGGERDRNYALYNFSFVFAEFLGWLEIIRQELVFVTGEEDLPLLGSLLEGIKFQLTGETPVQGTAPRGKEDDPEFEAQSKIFQLYAGELRSLGSVMIHTDSDGHKSIINADEFQRLMTVKAPAEGSSDQAKIDWARSRERLFQDMMLPLFDHLRTMAQLPKGQAPIRRLAIFQVLLVKLIDLVDNAVPYASGPKYDAGEEPQYINRDFRVTPLVAYLNSHQRTWLANQLFMEAAEKNIADPDWDAYMKDKEPTWRKLCFCGFREDLAALTQAERDKKPDMWPGACPPRTMRQRPDSYNTARGPGRSTAGPNSVSTKGGAVSTKAGGGSGQVGNLNKSASAPAPGAAKEAAPAAGPSSSSSGSKAASIPAPKGSDAGGGTFQAVTISSAPGPASAPPPQQEPQVNGATAAAAAAVAASSPSQAPLSRGGQLPPIPGASSPSVRGGAGGPLLPDLSSRSSMPRGTLTPVRAPLPGRVQGGDTGSPAGTPISSSSQAGRGGAPG